MARSPVTVVLDYRQAARTSFNVLDGALERFEDTAACPDLATLRDP